MLYLSRPLTLTTLCSVLLQTPLLILRQGHRQISMDSAKPAKLQDMGEGWLEDGLLPL